MGAEDPLLWHRLQFAFTIVYHYLFPQLTMGLALLIVVMLVWPGGLASLRRRRRRGSRTVPPPPRDTNGAPRQQPAKELSAPGWSLAGKRRGEHPGQKTAAEPTGAGARHP